MMQEISLELNVSARLLSFNERKHSGEILFNKAKDYFLAHINQPISLKLACKHLGCNHNLLISVFRSHACATPFEWLRKKRLTKAKQLLEQTELPIYLIALEVGYSDGNNFSTAFRKEFTVSPRQCRVLQTE